MAIDFKGAHYPKAVIVHAASFYVRYAVSYRDLEEILARNCTALTPSTVIGATKGVSKVSRFSAP